MELERMRADFNKNSKSREQNERIKAEVEKNVQNPGANPIAGTPVTNPHETMQPGKAEEIQEEQGIAEAAEEKNPEKAA